MGINKYKDLIVREPFPDVAVDLGIGHIEDEFGYIEAATRDRIPIEAVRNSYKSRLFRGRKQGYKLVGHHELLDDVLMALVEHPSLKKMTDVESLKATMYLSIYGLWCADAYWISCAALQKGSLYPQSNVSQFSGQKVRFDYKSVFI